MRYQVAKSLLLVLPWLLVAVDGQFAPCLPPEEGSAAEGRAQVGQVCHALLSLPNGLLYAVAPSCRL